MKTASAANKLITSSRELCLHPPVNLAEREVSSARSDFVSGAEIACAELNERIEAISKPRMTVPPTRAASVTSPAHYVHRQFRARFGCQAREQDCRLAWLEGYRVNLR